MEQFPERCARSHADLPGMCGYIFSFTAQYSNYTHLDVVFSKKVYQLMESVTDLVSTDQLQKCHQIISVVSQISNLDRRLSVFVDTDFTF